MIPDLKISDSEPIDDKGWWKSETIETTTQCIARIKEVLKEFKEFYKASDAQGKTFVAISHGYFLNCMACMFTNNLANSD